MEHTAFNKKFSVLKAFLETKRDNEKFELYPVGSYVWLPNEELAYEPAKVVAAIVKGDKSPARAIVERDGEVLLKDINASEKKNVVPMQEKYLLPETVMDINSIDLSGAAILHSLRAAFKNDCDYLQIGGRTLIYANRFEDDEYRMDKFQRMMEAKMAGVESNDPNIESLASACFDGLNRSAGKQSQSCVLFGTEESGRRTLAQIFARKVVQLSVSNDVGWWEKLNAAHDILSIFGGDRFVRWAELHMQYDRQETGKLQKGKLIGAALAGFLLDTSSITQAATTFECFYHLCDAAETTHRELGEKYGILPSQCYAYLNPDGKAAAVPDSAQETFTDRCVEAGCALECYGSSNRCVVHQKTKGKVCREKGCDQLDYGKGFCREHENRDLVWDKQRAWDDILKALKVLDISNKEVGTMVHMFVDMLELGNLDIGDLSKNGCQNQRIKEVFGIPLEGLVEILSVKTIKAGSETFYKTLPSVKISQRRDALVRSLYSGLFNWLIDVINRGVSFTSEAKQTALRFVSGSGNIDKTHRIGVIASLESTGLIADSSNSASNSLEQLINNYAQERLYTYYAINVIESVVSSWYMDGIAINFAEGNEMCLPLILEPRKKEVVQKKSSESKKPSVLNRWPNQNGSGVDRVGSSLPKTGMRKGILDIVEEELRIPAGSDKKLINKIESAHSSNKMLLLSPNKNYFKVHHYGANIVYNVKGFIKKTRSSVLPDAVRRTVIHATSKRFVRKLLTKHSAFEQQKNMARIVQKGKSQVKKDAKSNKGKGALSGFLDSGDTKNAAKNGDDEGFEFTRRVAGRTDGTLERMKKRTKQRFSVFKPNIGTDFGLSKSMSLTGVSRRKALNELEKEDENGDGDGDYEDRRMVTSVSRTGKTSSKPELAGGKRGDLENSTVVYNTMTTIVTLLETTMPHFVFCAKSNTVGEMENGFDSVYVYDQLTLFGIPQLFEQRLNNHSYGSGLKPDLFLYNYYALTLALRKPDRKNTQIVCEKLVDLNVIPEGGYAIGKSGRVYVKSGHMADLDTALSFAIEDQTTLIQSVVRRFIVRCKFKRKMEKFILQLLDDAIEGMSKEDLEVGLDMAERWNMARKRKHVAKAKLKKIADDELFRKELNDAALARDAFKLYTLLNKARQEQQPLSDELEFAGKVYGEIENERAELRRQGEEERKNMMSDVIQELREEMEFEANFNVDEFIEELRELKKQQDEEEARAKEDKMKEDSSVVSGEDDDDYGWLEANPEPAAMRSGSFSSEESDVIIVTDAQNSVANTPADAASAPTMLNAGGTLSRTASGRFQFVPSKTPAKVEVKPKLSQIHRTASGRFQFGDADTPAEKAEVKELKKLDRIDRTESGRFNFATVVNVQTIARTPSGRFDFGKKEDADENGTLVKASTGYMSTTFTQDDPVIEEEDDEEETSWEKMDSSKNLPFLRKIFAKRDRYSLGSMSVGSARTARSRASNRSTSSKYSIGSRRSTKSTASKYSISSEKSTSSVFRRLRSKRYYK